MFKFILCSCLVVALIYSAHGATQSELQRALNSAGDEVRSKAKSELEAATDNAFRGGVSSAKRSCLQAEIRAGHQEMNRDLNTEQQKIRMELLAKSLEEIGAMDVSTLAPQISSKLTAAVEPNLRSHINAMNKC